MKKNYENYFLYALLIIVIVGAAFFIIKPAVNSNMNTANTISKVSSGNKNVDTFKYNSVSTGTTSSGDVSVELEPNNVKDGRMSVKVSINTHSVNLNQIDLKQATTLEYDDKVIKPISAPRMGGHHVNGELVFEVEKDITKFTIKIKGIPNVEERIFEWK